MCIRDRSCLTGHVWVPSTCVPSPTTAAPPTTVPATTTAPTTTPLPETTPPGDDAGGNSTEVEVWVGLNEALLCCEPSLRLRLRLERVLLRLWFMAVYGDGAAVYGGGDAVDGGGAAAPPPPATLLLPPSSRTSGPPSSSCL
eukprot:3325770-Rhodomonas_salina.1